MSNPVATGCHTFTLLLNNSKNTIFAYNIVFLFADLDFIGTIFGKHDLLPFLTDIGISLPSPSLLPGPTSIILPWPGFSLSTVSGMKIPDLVFEPFSSSEKRLYQNIVMQRLYILHRVK